MSGAPSTHAACAARQAATSTTSEPTSSPVLPSGTSRRSSTSVSTSSDSAGNLAATSITSTPSPESADSICGRNAASRSSSPTIARTPPSARRSSRTPEANASRFGASTTVFGSVYGSEWTALTSSVSTPSCPTGADLNGVGIPRLASAVTPAR